MSPVALCGSIIFHGRDSTLNFEFATTLGIYRCFLSYPLSSSVVSQCIRTQQASTVALLQWHCSYCSALIKQCIQYGKLSLIKVSCSIKLVHFSLLQYIMLPILASFNLSISTCLLYAINEDNWERFK